MHGNPELNLIRIICITHNSHQFIYINMANQQSNPSIKPEIVNSHNSKDDRVFAAISYVSILCLVSLLLKKDNQFIQFHAKQGVVLLIAEIILWFVNIIPFFGYAIWRALSLVFLIVSIVGIVNAWKGKYWKLPLFSEYASKLKF